MDLFDYYNEKYDYLAVTRLFEADKPILAGRRSANVKKFGAGSEDAFFALNPMRPYDNGKFTAWQRSEDNVASLKFLYMDMDTEELFPDVPPENIFDLLYLEGVFPHKIPEPSAVIYSGRGIWFLWAINEHPKALPRWREVQKRIYHILKEYGADSRIINDPARLCRIPGSINPKNGHTVRFAPCSDRVYTLYEMLEYVPEIEKEEEKLPEHPISNAFLRKRAHDLAYILRNHRDFVGYREIILFLYRATLLSDGFSNEEALEATLELNASIENPLTEREVIRATASAQRREYKFTNKRIIDWLGLDRDEFDGLCSLVPKRIQRERTSMRNARNYRERLQKQGIDTKEERMEQTKRKLIGYIKQGLSPKQIQAKLKISRSTYYNYKKQLGMIVVDGKRAGMHRISSKNLLNQVSSGCPVFSAPILNARSAVVELTLDGTVETVRGVAGQGRVVASWSSGGGGGSGDVLLDTG